MGSKRETSSPVATLFTLKHQRQRKLFCLDFMFLLYLFCFFFWRQDVYKLCFAFTDNVSHQPECYHLDSCGLLNGGMTWLGCHVHHRQQR